jgi:adenosylmethionine-8-amino-7-oxononanoate aminotransferase
VALTSRFNAPASGQQELALRHLWMHFTELARYRDAALPIIERAEGCYVFDSEGRAFFDASSGLTCVNVGHGRTEIGEAMASQIARLDFWPIWSAATPPAIELAEKVAALAPGDLNRVFFTSSGSESIESAWKLARQYHRLRGKPHKTKLIARQGAYHGTTLGALSVTGVESIRTEFGPLVPDVLRAPAVRAFHADTDPATHSLACARAVEELIEQAGADTVAAVVVEPVQNAGGSLVAEPVYFEVLRQICDRHDVVLISDETICAWGRLGAFFGAQRLGYRPDIITTAKGITSAYVPMGAVIVSDAVAEPFLEPGVSFTHGHTYGGHPVAAAAALANIAIIEREGLCRRATETGEHLRNVLESLFDLPIVGDVRGMGLLQTVELVADRETRQGFTPEQTALLSAEIPAQLRDRGVLCRAMHRGAPLLQISPPLIATADQLTSVGDAIRQVLERVLERDALSGTRSRLSTAASRRR